MKITNILKRALEEELDCRYSVKPIHENDTYIYFLILARDNVHYIVEWIKDANYFCGITDMFMGKVNPIFAKEVANATERARNEISRTKDL